MMDEPIDSLFHPEMIDPSVFLAPTAIIRGRVEIGADSSVWFGAVIRGDTEAVLIGQRSNIQDLAVLHSDPGCPCSVGNGVTIGHAAVVHGARVEDDALIGIRAVVLNGAVVGASSILGAGAVVPEGMVIPPGTLAVGVPARVIRELGDEDCRRIRHGADHYVHAARAYRDGGGS